MAGDFFRQPLISLYERYYESLYMRKAGSFPYKARCGVDLGQPVNITILNTSFPAQKWSCPNLDDGLMIIFVLIRVVESTILVLSLLFIQIHSLEVVKFTKPYVS